MEVKNKSIFSNKGFSLVEILVAMGLAAMVSLAVMKINQTGMQGASAVASKIGLKMWQSTTLYSTLSRQPICGVNFGNAAQGGLGGLIPSGGTRDNLVRPVDIDNPTGGTTEWIAAGGDIP